MPIRIKPCKALYYSVPKIACTAIKHLIYQINNKKPFKDYQEGGKWVNIHSLPKMETNYYEAPPPEDMVSIVIIRDPVDRVLSAYANRVFTHWALTADRIATSAVAPLGLAPNPDPDAFFANFGAYCAASADVEFHVAPTTSFIGPNIDKYSFVFTMENIAFLTSLLSNMTGASIILEKMQEGNQKKPTFGDLSEASRRIILQHCMGDYALLRGHYEAPLLKAMV